MLLTATAGIERRILPDGPGFAGLSTTARARARAWRDPISALGRSKTGIPVTRPNHHFPDDVLRGFAIGTSPEATRLAVACHLTFCSTCQSAAADHERVLGA